MIAGRKRLASDDDNARAPGTYLAQRLATDDLTGGVDPVENEKGLDDARLGLDSTKPPGVSGPWAASLTTP